MPATRCRSATPPAPPSLPAMSTAGRRPEHEAKRMKLATLKTGNHDGRLHVVSRDLTRCVTARDATTLQQALDSWTEVAPLLHEEARRLEAGEWLGVEEFAPEECASPLPRA